MGLSFEPIDVMNLYLGSVEFGFGNNEVWTRHQSDMSTIARKVYRCAQVVRFGFALVGHSKLSFPIERSTFKTAGGPAHYAWALTLVIVANHHPMMDCTKV